MPYSHTGPSKSRRGHLQKNYNSSTPNASTVQRCPIGSYSSICRTRAHAVNRVSFFSVQRRRTRLLDLIGKEVPAASAPDAYCVGPINCCHIWVGVLSSRSLYFPAPCILIDCRRQILAPSPPIRLSRYPHVVQSSRRRRAARRRVNSLRIMPKRKHSEYYAVIHGFFITVPSIFSSW